jgi:hypothetical protein
MDMDDPMADMGGLRAVWNNDILVVINTMDDPIDASSLRLASAQGEIVPENWVMTMPEGEDTPYTLDAVPPGGCLLAYLADTEPEIPETVDCNVVAGEFTLTNPGDIVWDVSQGGFDAFLNGVMSAECSIDRTSCNLGAPN